MSKKSVNKRQVVARIKDLRVEGKTDTEIYAILSPEYHDRKTIAKIITATVTHERKEQYKVAQIILLGILGITILFKILMAFGFALALQSKVALITVFIFPALNIFFFVQVYRYSAEVYRVCGIFALLGIARSFSGKNGGPDWAIAVEIIIALVIIGLCFYLDSKLFPNYSPNNMKADANGDYRVE